MASLRCLDFSSAVLLSLPAINAAESHREACMHQLQILRVCLLHYTDLVPPILFMYEIAVVLSVIMRNACNFCPYSKYVTIYTYMLSCKTFCLLMTTRTIHFRYHSKIFLSLLQIFMIIIQEMPLKNIYHFL